MNHSLITYDLEGNGISEKKLLQKASNISIDENGDLTFLSYLRDSCLIWRMWPDNSLECVERGTDKIGPSYSRSEFRMARALFGSDLLVTFPLANAVYAIDDNQLHKKYIIDYGQKKIITSDFLSKMSASDQLEYYNTHNDFIQYSGMIFTTKNWLFFHQINKYYIRNSKAIPGYEPSEYIFYNPEKGVYSINSLEDDRVFKFSWRIRGSFDNTLIHSMYFTDRDRIVEEQIDLMTASGPALSEVEGERVLDLMDETAEILVLMKMK